MSGGEASSPGAAAKASLGVSPAKEGALQSLADDENASTEERLQRALERERQLRVALSHAADNTATWLKTSEERWSDALRQIATEAYVTSQAQPSQVSQPHVPPKVPSLAANLLHHNLGFTGMGAAARQQVPVIPSLQLQQAMMMSGLQLSGRSQQASSRLETPSSAMSSDRTHGTARGETSESPLDYSSAASKPPVPFLRLSALTGGAPSSLLSATKKDKRVSVGALSAPSSHSPSSPAINTPLLVGMLGTRHCDPVGCGVGDPMSERRYVTKTNATYHNTTTTTPTAEVQEGQHAR